MYAIIHFLITLGLTGFVTNLVVAIISTISVCLQINAQCLIYTLYVIMCFAMTILMMWVYI